MLETRKRREDLLQRCINENRETLLRYRNANKQEEEGVKTVNTSKEEMSAYANVKKFFLIKNFNFDFIKIQLK